MVYILPLVDIYAQNNSKVNKKNNNCLESIANKATSLQLRQACKYMENKTELGKIFFFGTNSDQDYEQANYWLTLAAKGKSGEANYYLAQLYYSGLGIKKNKKHAINLMRTSVKQGFKPAEMLLKKYSTPQRIYNNKTALDHMLMIIIPAYNTYNKTRSKAD